MKENRSNERHVICWKQFSHKSYAAFCSLKKEVCIGVLEVSTLAYTNPNCVSTQKETPFQTGSNECDNAEMTDRCMPLTDWQTAIAGSVHLSADSPVATVCINNHLSAIERVINFYNDSPSPPPPTLPPDYQAQCRQHISPPSLYHISYPLLLSVRDWLDTARLAKITPLFMNKLSIVIIMLFASISIMHAQNEQSALNNSVLLEEITVTSSRIATPLAQTPRLVTVITKEQIKQSQANSILDLLSNYADIDVLQRSPHGAQADISIRGGSFDQTAVLLNGVNISNAQTGHYSFDIPINMSDIERIEVLRGPSALIYGASAFSGGVNIITKKEVQEKAYVGLTAGMHSLRSIEARGALKTGMATHSLSVGNSSSNGYIRNTDYTIYNVLWQTRINLNRNNKIDVQIGYNDKDYGANSFYTAAFPDQYEYTNMYLGTAKGEFGDKLKFIPIVYWTRHTDRFDLIKDSVYGRNHHRGDTYGTNLILQYASKYGVSNLATEVRKEDITSSNLGKAMAKPHGKYTAYDDRTNVSASIEHTAKIDKVSLSAGVLMNYNSFLRGKYRFYPSASVSYRPLSGFTSAVSWSKSTRMPTFTELYYNTETHVANENLQPEKSESLDLSLKYRNTLIDANVTGFLLWGKNMIDWIKADANAKSESTNITEVNTKGIESNVRFRLGQIVPLLGSQSTLTLGYTRMWQNHQTNEYISESKNKLNYLRDKLTMQFTHQIIRGLSADWFFRYQKRMGSYTLYVDHQSSGQTVNYPAFSTLDLKLSYTIEQLSINLSLNNIADKKYVDLGNIQQPGFWMIGGISYAFK